MAFIPRLHLRPPQTTINLADYGAKELTTTGSISAGSNQLTVANASGFSVNDYVIVGIGGEAGAGARNTVGVGGVWPDLSYADATAMNADNSKSEGQFCYLLSTGVVYNYVSGAWDALHTVYYTAVKIPRALTAKITAKIGNVLTLDTPATVTSTNATVYFDNYRIFLQFGDFGSGYADHLDIVLPSGTLWTSRNFFVWQHNHWRIMGAGVDKTIVAFPDGISDIAVIQINQCTNVWVSDLTTTGNLGDSGYMVAWLNGDQTVAKFAYGIYHTECGGGGARNTKSIDAFQGGISISFCVGTSSYDHWAALTGGIQCYMQWQIAINDSIGGVLQNSVVTCPKLTAGIELFRTSGSQIINYTGTNAVVSLNSADSYVVNGINVTLEPTSYDNETAFSRNNAIVAVDTNIITDAPNGGAISNITITQSTVLSSQNDSLRAIEIATTCPNVTIDTGTITLPSYTSPSSLVGALAVHSNGDNTTVSNLTVVGNIKAASGYGNLTFNGSNGRYHNITANSIVGGTPF